MRIRYWSSDVCSSDLDELFKKLFDQLRARGASTTDYDNIRSTFRQLCVRYALTGIPQFVESHREASLDYIDSSVCRLVRDTGTRSEERRVGKRCGRTGSLRWQADKKKKKNT